MRVSGSDDSCSSERPATMVYRPMGRLMKNAQRQPRVSTIAAPSVGPSAPATAPAAPQMATARGSWSWAKACITSASDAGIRAAAPAAWIDAEHDQQLCGRRQTARHRRDREECRSGEEDAAVADAIGDLAGGDQEGGEHDGVGVEHPGELGRTGVGEGGGDVGKRDVEDRRVEERRQRGQRGDEQRAIGMGVHVVSPAR